MMRSADLEKIKDKHQKSTIYNVGRAHFLYKILGGKF